MRECLSSGAAARRELSAGCVLTGNGAGMRRDGEGAVVDKVGRRAMMVDSPATAMCPGVTAVDDMHAVCGDLRVDKSRTGARLMATTGGAQGECCNGVTGCDKEALVAEGDSGER